MAPPPRNPDHRSPKRSRYAIMDEESSEEEDNHYIVESSDDDFTDLSADEEVMRGGGGDEEDDVEVVADDVTVTVAQSGRSVRSSSPSSQLSLKLNTSDVLDCPTCYEPLETPIFQCENGHITCSTCLPKVYSQCPECRIPIGGIRCRAMEKVIESSAVPCCNAVYGCREISLYGKHATHEKECVYIRCSCPVPNCYYTGGYMEVESHARARHAWDVENLIPFSFDVAQIFTINLAKKKTAVLQEDGEGDLIVVQAFVGAHGGGVSVTVSRIAPLTVGLRNLTCCIAKINAYSTLKLGLRMKHIQNVREHEEPPTEDFLFVPDWMLNGGHYLKLRLCVGHGVNYVHI